MTALRAHIENGRVVLDEPMDLPDGTELYLVPVEESGDVVLLQDDGLDDEERDALLKAIDDSLAEADAGEVEDFSRLVAQMRQQS
jgi:hypothetical protein